MEQRDPRRARQLEPLPPRRGEPEVALRVDEPRAADALLDERPDVRRRAVQDEHDLRGHGRRCLGDRAQRRLGARRIGREHDDDGDVRRGAAGQLDRAHPGAA